jgi:hypothetical protein
MACNACENIAFTPSSALVLTIEITGSTARLYVRNQSKHAVEIRRILLCSSNAEGFVRILFLRAAPAGITWIYPLTWLEQGINALFYELTDLPPGQIIQAQAEYLEFNGRSKSCVQTVGA